MLLRKNTSKFFQSKSFKKTTFCLGIVFFVLSLFIVLDPKPFTRYGYLGVFVFNLFGPGTLIFPSLSRYMNIPLLAAVTSLGMMFNDSVAWLVGYSSEVFVGKPEKLKHIQSSIEKYGLWALLFWSIIPFPYDFAGLVAGYLKIPYRRFILPTFTGKFIRFILLGYGFLKIFKL